MSNYYRITGYYPDENYCFILDSNGKFEKLWEFSEYLVSKGLRILAVSKEETMIDINIGKVDYDTKNIFLRVTKTGLPEEITQIVNGITYKAIKIEDKIYISNKENNRI